MVRVVLRKEEWELRAGMAVRDILLKLELDPHAYLAVRDGQLINEATFTDEGDLIKLVPVISGG